MGVGWRDMDYAQDNLGGTYLPEPVLVETMDGKCRAALCYIALSMEARTPSRVVQRVSNASDELVRT